MLPHSMANVCNIHLELELSTPKNTCWVALTSVVQHQLDYILPCYSCLLAVPPLSSTGTLSVEVIELNDHAPVLWQHSAELCSSPHHGHGILLSATDEDMPPQSHPFQFQLDQSSIALTLNWSISEINSK